MKNYLEIQIEILYPNLNKNYLDLIIFVYVNGFNFHTYIFFLLVFLHTYMCSKFYKLDLFDPNFTLFHHLLIYRVLFISSSIN